MLNMNWKLEQREKEGKIIKVGIVGAGQMGRGMVTQMVLMKGMTPAIVSDINVDLAVQAFKYAEVADEEIVKRMSGRRVCEKCGASFHTEYKKPAIDGICDLCDGKLVIRKDDEPETVLNRLEVYHNQTEPLKEYYKSCGKLITVEGQDEVKDTTRLVLEALES